jgi:hypothetical protein
MADALVYGYTHHPAPLSITTPRPAADSPVMARGLSDLLRSVLEEMEEPARPDHLGSQGLGPAPELAIGGHEGDRLVGGPPSHDIDEGVVATALGMDHGDAVGPTVRHALAGRAFEHHDDGLIDPSRRSGHPHRVDECFGGSRSVPPPPRWARTDDVGCIDEKHGSGQDWDSPHFR